MEKLEKEFGLGKVVKMYLSFSTMRLLYQCPHNYLNKISGIPQPSRPEFEEGKEAHKIIQAHLSGKEIREDLST
jgi:hypothetical protein